MNFLKKMALLLTVAALMAGVFCGCSSEDPSGSTTTEAADHTYSITVTDQNGDAVVGAIIQFTDTNGTNQLKITGADGSASVTSETAIASATLSSLPDGYTCESNTVSFNGSNSVTAEVTAVSVEDETGVVYTVTVVDQNGNAVAGVELQFCDEDSCKTPVLTDENGTVTQEYPEAVYHITVNEMPEGYSCDPSVYYFEDGKTEMTIVLTAN